METFFTADLHFNHRNCAIKWRGFPSVDEHNEHIIDKWNAKVGKRDVVYVLGDVSLSVAGIQLVRELKGIKHLILGNHDHHNMRNYIDLFNRIRGVDLFNNEFALSHIPVHPDNLEFRFKCPNLHGHIHKTVDIPYTFGPQYFNVNLEYHDFAPLSLEDIRGTFSE